MARAPLVFGGLAVLLVVAIAGGYLITRPTDYKLDRAPLLTAVPNAGSFEPREMPAGPVLFDTSGDGLAVDFGYEVAGTAYFYTLALRFPADADDGKTILTARHAGKAATTEMPALRLWDAPRDAYAVAVQAKFDIAPAVPALCVKAVVGASKARYDLKDASLCVAQRDIGGACHPETLACGLIRSKT